MNIGEKIIAAIAQSHLVTTDDPYSVLIWSQSAAEQLEAVVAAEIEDRMVSVKSTDVSLDRIARALESEYTIEHRAGGKPATTEQVSQFIQDELRRQAGYPGIKF